MDLHFKWVKNIARHQTGESLYLNKIRVGSYGWNASRSKSNKDESIDWVGRIELPSLSDIAKTAYGNTETEVKVKIEQIVTSWFQEATR